jgi:hypothetical protein
MEMRRGLELLTSTVNGNYGMLLYSVHIHLEMNMALTKSEINGVALRVALMPFLLKGPGFSVRKTIFV